MGLLLFKRISKTPLTPKVVSDITLPTQAEISVMTLAAALLAGKSIGVHPETALTLYAPSETGIGFKVWSIWRDGTKVTVEWGHESKRKRRKTADLFTESGVGMFMHDQWCKKLAKGYKRTK